MTDYFDNWFFTTNATRNVCPGFGSFKCEPPNACARDPNTGKRYCCDPGNKGVCWTTVSPCRTDGSTLDCGSGSTTWCCLNKREICTETQGQINICWSSAANTLRNISTDALQSAHSSLSSARPSASSLTFDPVSLIALTAPVESSTSTSSTRTTTGTTIQTTPTSSTTTGTAGGATGPTDIPSSGQTSSSSSSLSGGAIAGIAVGAAAGVAILAVIAFMYWRRNKTTANGANGSPSAPTAQHSELAGPAPNGNGYAGGYSPGQDTFKDGTSLGPPSTMYHEAYGKYEPSGMLAELSHGDPRVELPGNQPGWELPSNITNNTTSPTQYQNR